MIKEYVITVQVEEETFAEALASARRDNDLEGEEFILNNDPTAWPHVSRILAVACNGVLLRQNTDNPFEESYVIARPKNEIGMYVHLAAFYD